MSQVVIELPEDVAARLAERAVRDHVTPEEVASKAVRSYLGSCPELPFPSLGASGSHDTGVRAEETLAQGFGQ